MTAAAAVFDYVSPDRGPRRIVHYLTLNQTHARVAVAADENFVQRFLRELSHRNYSRTASAAGPLTPEYAVRLFKPAMTWFVRTQVQLDAMKQQTSNVVQAAKAETKPAAAKAPGAKGGFASGAKSLASRIGAMMSGLSGPSKSANAHPDDDDWDDGLYAPRAVGMSCNACSCPEPKPR